MKILRHITDVKETIGELKKANQTIGFVPTMGALHQGHLSLVEQSVKHNDITVVSIFVNPTQFNNPNDLKTYPRCEEQDLEQLATLHPDFVFIPTVDEMYPEKDNRKFSFGKLDTIMEGKNRPGHFNGVAQVVSKLFDIVLPDNAYFGQKDFQQIAIVKQMVRDLRLDVNIVPCPIIREKDGLAMSSRNRLLSDEQRKNVPLISQTLLKSCTFVPSFSVEELKKWVVDEINKNPYLEVEYFEIVDDIYLNTIESWDEDNVKVGCITVQVGDVRLIDNITFNK